MTTPAPMPNKQRCEASASASNAAGCNRGAASNGAASGSVASDGGVASGGVAASGGGVASGGVASGGVTASGGAPFTLHHCRELEESGAATAFFNEGSYAWRGGFLPEGTAARANFEQLAAQTGISAGQMICAIQTHTGTVRAVGREHAGEGVTRPHTTGEHDALITNEPGLLLCVMTADCLPIFLLDPVHRAIGLVHSGWRGTVQLIGPAALDMMSARYGTRARDVLVHFGPSICGECYEVGADVRDEFAKAFTEEELGRFFAPKGSEMPHSPAATQAPAHFPTPSAAPSAAATPSAAHSPAPCTPQVPATAAAPRASMPEAAATQKYLLDNELAARISLLRAGVSPDHITSCGICTFEHAEFESYRRTGSLQERILSAFMLND